MGRLIRCSCDVLVDESILDKHVCDGSRPAYDALKKQVHEMAGLLGPAYVYLTHYVPVEEAEINGFNIDAWSEAVEALGVNVD